MDKEETRIETYSPGDSESPGEFFKRNWSLK